MPGGFHSSYTCTLCETVSCRQDNRSRTIESIKTTKTTNTTNTIKSSPGTHVFVELLDLVELTVVRCSVTQHGEIHGISR